MSDWKILDRDASIDICVFEIPNDANLERLNKKKFELQTWPHTRAALRDNALIIGYPAEHRSGSSNEIHVRITPINDFVTDVGPRRFTIADEQDEREVLLNPEGFSVPAHFGGMSGSPVFRMLTDAKPEFIGVFSEGGDGLRAAFFCAHADFILPTGKLDFGRIPPR